jgi:hypothetical protein
MRRFLLALLAVVILAGLVASAFWLRTSSTPLREEPPPVGAPPAAATRSQTAEDSDTPGASIDARATPNARTPPAPTSRARQAGAAAPTPTPSNIPAEFWLTREELAALPPLPEHIREWAERDIRVRIGDQDNQADAVAVAAAYACANTGEQDYCDRVRALLEEVAGVDVTGMKTLALNRNLTGYVVAASLIDYHDPAFAAWLQEVIHAQTWNAWTDDWSIYRSAVQEPSNGGCHARAAVTAVALYTADAWLLEEMANRFHDWLGRSSAGWLWDRSESWWQSAAHPAGYNGVNPAGATLVIDGESRNVDGVLPEDMKRSGRPEYPFPVESYVRECQQGMIAAAWMLHRAGYPAFEWEDQAVLRSFRWFAEEAEGAYRGDDAGLPYLIRLVYGVDYATEQSRPGKNGLGFYDWTHGGGY